MIQVSHSGKELIIDGKSIQVQDDILSALAVNDRVVVLLDMGGETSPNNVVSFNKDGKKLWEIETAQSGEVGVENGQSQPTPYTGIRCNDGTVEAHNYNSARYEVDLDTGQVEYIGWKK